MRSGSRVPVGLARRLPSILLVLTLAAVGLSAAISGHLRPVLEPDTESYLKAPLDEGAVQVLSYYRTPGYPWFLSWGRRLGPGFTPIPWLQASLYAFGVLVFFAGLRRLCGRPWVALAATLPLAFAAVTAYTPRLLTESPAAGLTLIAAGLTFAVAAASGSRLPGASARVRACLYLTLALTVFCANQVRPTTQWLLVWVPLAVAILARSGRGRVWSSAGLAALATFVPWLAFASLRLLVVAHFGLVSFAGTNLATIGTFLADEETVAAMADDVRPTARLIVKRRDNNGWPRLEFGDDARPWFRRYNESLWKVNYRSANWHMHRQLGESEGRSEVALWGRPFPIERDRRLQAFAVGAIRRNPGGYLAWITGALRHGLAGMLRMPTVVLGLGLIALAILRRFAVRSRDSLASPLPGAAAVCGMHAAGALLLVSLISFPNQRYLSEATLLLPTGLVLLAAALWPARPKQPVPGRWSGNA